MGTTMQEALEVKKEQRDQEANIRGYIVRWDTPNKKVTIMSPFGEGGVFPLYKFLLSADDIKTFFYKHF